MGDTATNLAIKISADATGATTVFTTLAKTGASFVDTLAYGASSASGKMAGLETAAEKVGSKFGSMGAIGNDILGGLAGKFTESLTNISPYAMAVELAAKAWGMFKDAARDALGILEEGGKLNVTTTAFEALAKSSGVSGDEILRSMTKISDGTLSMADSMQVATRAIRAGFSEDQITTVVAFARKYSQATGAGFEETANAISEAMMTGRTRTLKVYGIMTDDIATAFSQLKKQTAAFGEGAFDFSSIEKAASTQLGDLADSIGMTWNKMLGKSVTGDALKGLIVQLEALAERGPEIAEALGAPVLGVFDSLSGAFSEVMDLAVGMGVTMTDVTDAFRYAGIGVMALAGGLETMVNVALIPIQGVVGGVTLALAKMGEVTGIMSEESVFSMNRLGDSIMGAGFNTDKLGARMIELDSHLGKNSEQVAALSEKHAGLSGSIKDHAKAEESLAQSMEKNEKAMSSLDSKAAAFSSSEHARVQKTIDDMIATDKQREKSNAATDMKLQKEIDDADTWQKKDAAIAAWNEEQAKRKNDLADMYAKEQAARVEEEKKVFAERRERENQEMELLEKDAQRRAELARQEGTPQSTETQDNSTLAPATKLLVEGSQKSADSSAAVIASNNALVAILTALQKGGLKMLIQVMNGDNAIGQLVRRVIQDSEIQAQLSGATVPAA